MTQSPAAQDQTKKSGLFKSSAVISSMTFLSRILGMIRDMVIAIVIGASAGADAFFIAFKIPNFMRRLFAEGAFSQAFVPVLSEYRIKRNHDEVRELLDRVAGVLGGTLFLFTGLAILGAPVLAGLFAPGYLMKFWQLGADGDGIKYLLASDMIRITFPYLLLISLAGFTGAVLNSYGRFAVPAFTPVLLNVVLIIAALVVSPWFEEPAFALAWGVLLAGFVQFFFQLPFVRAINLMPRPVWDMRDSGVRRILALMGPAIFGVSVSQINLLLDTILASFLPTGSVSWLYFSDRLVELPLGIFAIAISTVILPGLSRHQASDSPKAFSATLDWAIRMVLLVGAPAAIALMVLAEPILMTLFQYGKLTVNDVTMAGYSLRAYAVGLLAFMLIKVLAPGYYSRQDTKTPVKIGIKAMVTNMILNLVLVVPLHYFWQVGHVGLALATSLAACLNVTLLYQGLRRDNVYLPEPLFVATVVRVTFAASMMGIVIWLLSPDIAAWSTWGWPQRAINLLPLCFAGIVVYFALLWLTGARAGHFLAHPEADGP